jgi:hypothetical protein
MGAYLLQGQPLNTKLASMPMWLLFPNGKVQQVFDPTGKPWARTFGGQQLFTKRGVIFVQHDLRTTRLGEEELRDSGLYILEDEKPRRVLSAFLDSPALSSDGCRLAVVKRRLQTSPQKLRPEERYRIAVVDLCEGGQDVDH